MDVFGDVAALRSMGRSFSGCDGCTAVGGLMMYSFEVFGKLADAAKGAL